MDDALSRARTVHQEMIDLRRHFHMNPEIGFDVHQTAARVVEELKKLGLSVRAGIGKTGVVADLIVPNATRTIALRADMDALPMEELSDVPYRSQIPMRAHMCGHDAHTAMLIGAAKILSEMKDRLPVNVRFIFQPNEEVFPGGAKSMIQDGALIGVDEIYAVHVMPTLPTSQYGICVGHALAQPDAFEITITGCGGHAALPHKAINPVMIAAEIAISIQSIVARLIDPIETAVITISEIHGGDAFNVIPETCMISGTVRTYEKEAQEFIRKKMGEIVEGIAGMYGAKGILKYIEGFPSTYNHKEQAIKAKEVGISLVGEECLDFPAQKMMYGEDFGYFTQQIKGCYILLGCRNEKRGITHMLHNPRFDIDEECLVYGAAMHIGLVESFRTLEVISAIS